MKIGTGSFGVAYKRPNDSYVYKLFVEDSAYAKFVEYSIKNPSEHFPKIYGYKTLSAFWKRPPSQIDERLYIAKVEHVIIASSLHRAFRDAADRIYEIFDGIEYTLTQNSTVDQIKDMINDNIAEYDIKGTTPKFVNKLIGFIDTIRKFSNATNIDFPQAVDLHPGNIGFRKNGEWVLVDPVYDSIEMAGNKYHHPTERDVNFDAVEVDDEIK
jgi:hypothetical protein